MERKNEIGGFQREGEVSLEAHQLECISRNAIFAVEYRLNETRNFCESTLVSLDKSAAVSAE